MLAYQRTTLEGLSDIEKTHYKEKDGKFFLDVDDKEDTRVKGLIKNRNEAFAEKEALQIKLTALEAGSGTALKEALAKIDVLEKTKGKAPDVEKQLTQIKIDLETEYKSKLDEKDTQLKTIQSRVSQSQRDTAIKDALIKTGVKSGALDMMSVFLRDRVDVVEGDTGAFTVRIKKESGEGHEVSTQDGSVFKTVGEFVEEIKVNKDFGFVFDGSKASGSGAVNTTGTGLPAGEGNKFANVKSRADLKDASTKTAYLAALTEANGGDKEKASDAFFALPATAPSG